MALKKETKERIKHYIMELIYYRDSDYVRKAAENSHVSKTTIYKYIKELEDDGALIKKDGKYELVTIKDVNKCYDMTKSWDEDRVYSELIEPQLTDLPDNLRRIWRYSFTEMFNNVIDHANAKNAIVMLWANKFITTIVIVDDGVGIFNKIAEYYNYDTLDDAILNLFKGKLTTDKDNHSGEGIFFTSKAVEHFQAISSNKVFSQNNNVELYRDVEELGTPLKKIGKRGTTIIMAMSNNSKRTLKEVFNMYSDVDGGLTRTLIPMTLICDGGFPVSRSQAKRLYAGFDKFEKVTLDFSGIDEIGQGFAHELFNVFQRRHPEIELECINANEDIFRMIRHVSE